MGRALTTLPGGSPVEIDRNLEAAFNLNATRIPA